MAHTVVLGLTMTPSAEIAEGVGLTAERLGIGRSRTYITYVFKDSTGIRYVGRASGSVPPRMCCTSA